jgi:hypothetical protein
MMLTDSGGTLQSIRGVLEDILTCKNAGVEYVPKRKCTRMDQINEDISNGDK